jgi:hypothetical protein
MTETKPSNIRVFLPKDATAKYLVILSEVQKYQGEIENEMRLREGISTPKLEREILFETMSETRTPG